MSPSPGARVAVKIIRNVQKYRDAAKIEIDILRKIRDAGGCDGSVEMLSSFDYYGHVCVVFEVHDLSLSSSNHNFNYERI